MKLREAPLPLIAPLGLAAALLAHALLQVSGAVGMGAPAYSSHAHTAVEPVAIVEISIALWFFGFAVRDALLARNQPHYKLASRPGPGFDCIPLCSGCISLIAIATLFGMEYAESGSAALGLGWLGGALVPGALALASGIASAVAVLYFARAGYLAGFDYLVGLFAAALARFIATLLVPASKPSRRAARPLMTRTAPVARHAGLRAPPVPTR